MVNGGIWLGLCLVLYRVSCRNTGTEKESLSELDILLLLLTLRSLVPYEANAQASLFM